MAASPQDGETLNLPPELVRYVRHLTEPIEKYSQYFDAMLIRRRDHDAFFRDMKAFRSQEYIIALLTTTDHTSLESQQDTPRLDIKSVYRECTRSFLASRFAHPWCRSTPAKEGWVKAEWGNIKKQSESKRKDEERLHKLLVPIWCGFRVRMMPSQEQLETFLKREDEVSTHTPSQLLPIGGDSQEAESRPQSMTRSKEEVDSPSDDITRDSTAGPRHQTIGKPPGRFNAEAFVMEEDDRAYEQTQNDDDREGAAAAAKMFIGVAATTFLAKNPRARKYLMKKLNKK